MSLLDNALFFSSQYVYTTLPKKEQNLSIIQRSQFKYWNFRFLFKFKKENRILKRKDFLFLSRFGKKYQNRCFIVLVCKSKNLKKRIGITITTKVCGAVKRNLIKRIAREFFRLNKDKLIGYFDINIIAKKEASKLNSQEILFYTKDLFEKTKLLNV